MKKKLLATLFMVCFIFVFNNQNVKNRQKKNT